MEPAGHVEGSQLYTPPTTEPPATNRHEATAWSVPTLPFSLEVRPNSDRVQTTVSFQTAGYPRGSGAAPDRTICSERRPYASWARSDACAPVIAPCELWVSKLPSSVPATRVPLLLTASDSSIDSAQILSERKKP